MPSRGPSFSLLIASALLMAYPSGADAFCVVNATEERLLFAAWPHGGGQQDALLRRWLDPGAKACAKPDTGSALVDVFVFAGEDAIEGCDDEIAAAGTLTLKTFEEFDRCAWSK